MSTDLYRFGLCGLVLVIIGVLLRAVFVDLFRRVLSYAMIFDPFVG
ncbi:MAG: hypothetical protein LBQ66_13175 [Planctomycetaceae bacterium]|nr:hypothetical protein [Planctomycetaceae bacterium]